MAIFWAFANALIKLSILFFYRRVFVGPIFNVATWILISLSIVWLIYDIIGWLLYCGTDLQANFEGPWDNCPLWGFEVQIGVFVLDSFIDFFILILPMPFVSNLLRQAIFKSRTKLTFTLQVWKLQLGASKKIVIVMIFLLGGL